MPDTKFTPGPWVDGRDGQIFSPDGLFTLASIHEHEEDENGAEWEGNRRLIAAAPDLYAHAAFSDRVRRAESITDPDDIEYEDVRSFRWERMVAILPEMLKGLDPRDELDWQNEFWERVYQKQDELLTKALAKARGEAPDA